MAAEHSDEVSSLKQQLVEKDQEISRLRSEKNELEENLDEQEESAKETRNTFKKRINALENDLDEKDEQIDSLSEEITRLKNNNQIQSSETSPSLKDQIQNKEMALAEMREKLNKGGMTINNLHMEIGDLKESLKEANDTITSKSAKIKEMREENSKIKASVLELQSRLDCSQTDHENTEQQSDFGGKVQLEVLKKEMAKKNEELLSVRIKLEKCQKELTDTKQKLDDINLHNHSETNTNIIPKHEEELVSEKSKVSDNSDLQIKLDKALADYRKAVQALTVMGCLILAYVVAKVIY